MIFAVVGGMHGNLPAMKAVLHAVDEEGVHTVLSTGNLVVGAPWPRDVIDCMKDRAIHVQGLWDRRVVRARRKAGALQRECRAAEWEWLAWTYDMLMSAQIEFLHGLPHDRHVTLEGVRIALAYGSLTSQKEVLDDASGDDRFARQRELTDARLIVLGGSRTPYVRRVEDTLFVNPGSAGLSKTPGEAPYALVSTEEAPYDAEVMTVAYDYGKVAEACDKIGLPPLTGVD